MIQTASAPASVNRLREFFHASSIALVGASDTSGWGRNVFESLQTAGFQGTFVPVHPRHPTAYGLPTRSSLCDLEQPVELAFVLAPTEAVESVVRDAAAAGVRNLVILAAGFGEQGEAGRKSERRLVELAAEHDILLLGPNGLGFINAPARVAPYGLNIAPPLIAGSVGVVLQSGALASAVLGFARGHAIGLSLLISMGNEAMITTADVIEYLIEDSATRVIALFLEEIRQPRRFAALAERARERGKPLIALKVGRSAAGQRVALAHTGSVAGDDAVVDAALRQFGVIRVRSLEELLVTAGLLSTSPPLKGRRMGVVTASGGACDIIADRAADEGIEIPPFAAETVAALAQVLPPFTIPQNPVDATGFGLAHQASAARPITGSLDAVTHDPNIDFVFYTGLTLPSVAPPDPEPVERRLDQQAELLRTAPIPVVSATMTCSDIGDYARSLLLPRGLSLLPGLDLGLSAIGHALSWEERRAQPPRSAPERGLGQPDWLPNQPGGVWSEAAGRRLLDEAGVPTVPAELAHSADEAVLAAERLGYPVVLKACAAGIAHKSDIGGVALNLSSASSVREAFEKLARIRPSLTLPLSQRERELHSPLPLSHRERELHSPLPLSQRERELQASPLPVGEGGGEGVLVAAMRSGGHELLAGVTVDPTFGPVLAVGLGGIWVETLRDVALRVLPVDRADARLMLEELRASPVLKGARGGVAVDLDCIADTLVRVTYAALMLGPRLRALEVNPLWCSGREVEALDVLVVTDSGEV